MSKKTRVTPQCCNCVWWVPRPPDGPRHPAFTGNCHGGPPTAYPKGEGIALWPLTWGTNFCKDFEEV